MSNISRFEISSVELKSESEEAVLHRSTTSLLHATLKSDLLFPSLGSFFASDVDLALLLLDNFIGYRSKTGDCSLKMSGSGMGSGMGSFLVTAEDNSPLLFRLLLARAELKSPVVGL